MFKEIPESLYYALMRVKEYCDLDICHDCPFYSKADSKCKLAILEPHSYDEILKRDDDKCFSLVNDI